MTTPNAPKRIVILGAGFGGLYTAIHLERQLKHRPDVEITLVSRDNYFLVTPLLFEAASGVLDPRHVVSPIRKLLDRTRFVEADVESIDFTRQIVRGRQSPSDPCPTDLPYDHLVLAVGGVTNTKLIPGSRHALTFKTLADAIALRNHVIDLFERADVCTDPQLQRDLLTFVVIGGGLVGVELMAELQQFVKHVRDHYPRVPADRLRFVLLEALPKILPELEEDLATYAADVLKRRGVDLRTSTKVARIEPGRLYLPTASSPFPSPGIPGAGRDEGSAPTPAEEVIPSHTIITATGVLPNPLLATLDIPKDSRGRLPVHPTMQSTHLPNLWALGDCAAIPAPDGRPYPPLAQHALREAKTLAANIAAVLDNRQPKPFVYSTLGTLAALGHYNGVGKVFKFKVKGFLAWWVWRSYYMLQMPRWERRIRLVFDWTIAMLFKYDIVKLDLAPPRSPPHPDPSAPA